MNIDERIGHVRNQMATSIEARGGGACRLVAVTKTVDIERIRAAIMAGQRIFAENRVQEALVKWPTLRTEHADISLHLIGSLQINKAKQACALFDVIETLDRPKLAQRFVHIRDEGQALPELLVQVNIGSESQKSGVDPLEVDAFLAFCRQHLALSIAGLMCIPPASENPMPFFALLSEMARRNQIDRLSMGMSGDFADAIAMGATEIRVGSAIFGTRM